MDLDSFLGSSEGHIVQAVTYQSDTVTNYENFYEPPYAYLMHGTILIVCLVFLLLGFFSFIKTTR